MKVSYNMYNTNYTAMVIFCYASCTTMVPMVAFRKLQFYWGTLKEEKVRALFAIIKELRSQWAFADGAEEAPLNMEPSDSDTFEYDPENYEDQIPGDGTTPEKSSIEQPPKLERKGAKTALHRSQSSVSGTSHSLSPANACLKGLGINVTMTAEQEAELHSVLKAINELQPMEPPYPKIVLTAMMNHE